MSQTTHHPTHQLAQAIRHDRGFTLIELAVVLAVISLLLGGVFKGQELVHSARARAVAQDFRSIAAAVSAYQDRFRSLPGDDPLASTHLSGAGLADSAGLGNGLINGAWNSTTATDESLLLWQHLRLAGLVSGNTSTPPSDAGALASWLPRNAVGGRIGLSSTAPVGTWAGSLFICQDGISGRVALQVDTQLDDGNPASGTIRLLDAGALVSTGSVQEGASYTVCMAG